MFAAISKQVFGVGFLGVVQKLVLLVTAILLSRLLGVDGYGEYIFLFSIVTICCVPGTVGLSQLAVREVASSLDYKDKLRDVYSRLCKAAIVSIILAEVAIILFIFFYINVSSWASVVSCLFPPALVGVAISSSILRAQGKLYYSQWPKQVAQPAIFVILVFLLSSHIDYILALFLNFLSALAVCVFYSKSFQNKDFFLRNSSFHTTSKGFWKSYLSFTFLGGFSVINTKIDVVLLGVMSDKSEVGIYGAAFQLASVLTFSLVVIKLVIGPSVSTYFKKNLKDKLCLLMCWSSFFLLVVSSILLILMFLFSDYILLAVFGEEFQRGNFALLILSAGQAFSSIFGAVGLFLSMTRHENDTLRVVILSSLINLALNIYYIPVLGAVGAAYASFVSIVIANILFSIKVYQRLGILSGPFSFIYFFMMRKPNDNFD